MTYAAVFASSAYMQAPANAAYQFGTGDFTLEAWVKCAQAGGNGTIIGRKGSSGGSGNGGFLLVLEPNGALKLATDNGYGYFQVVTQATRANDGDWHHVAGVRQGAGLTIYVDGAAVLGQTSGNAQPPLDVSNGLPLTIATVAQGQEPDRFLTGQLGGVMVWNVARSAAQVAADLNNWLDGSQPGLVGYWTFSNQDGTDSSSVHNNAAPQGSVTYQSPGAPVGKYYFAAVLANGAYLQAPGNGAFGSGDFTLEAWVKSAQAGGSGTIIGCKGTGGGSGDGGFLLVLNPNGTLKLATDNGYGYFQVVTQATRANDGTWHQVAAVRQGTAFSMYVDGVAVPGQTSGNASPPLYVTNGQPLTIGWVAQQQEPYRSFSGQVDAVAMWNVARSAAQVSADMNGRLNVSQPGLVSYWTFDSLSGADSSPSHNNASPVGTVTYLWPGAPVGQPISGKPTISQVSYDGTTLSAQWSAVQEPPVTGYTLAVFDSAGNPVVSTGATGTSGSFRVALSAQAYTARVCATGTGTTGPWSDPVWVIAAPPAIESVSYDGAVTVVTFTAPPSVQGITGYTGIVLANGQEAYRGTTAQSPLTIPGTLQAAKTNAVRAQATGDKTTGPWSPDVPAYAAVPAGLLVGSDGEHVTAAWKPVDGVGYEATLSQGGTWGTPQATGAASITFAEQLTAGVVYAARVRISQGNSRGPWSQPVPGPCLRSGTITYDRFGRVTSVSFPAVSTTTYTYDDLGNITAVAVTGPTGSNRR